MDPITQGLLGALAAQTVAKKEQLGKASLIGALSGMAPDLDVLIQSDVDPLLFLEYHRHFTHSLFFIPFGGALCGLLFFALLGKTWKLDLRSCVLWSILGFATHGLLDACTSYGTQLLWPFSDLRVAWDLMSIIDPIFSGILLLSILIAIFLHKKIFVAASCAWLLFYFSLAFAQHQRAMSWGREFAEENGHEARRLSAKPSFGNILIWKVIYEEDGHYHVAAVKLGLNSITSWNGESAPKLNVERDFPWLSHDSQQADDIERFAHFSMGHLAVDPNNPMLIGDMRYSTLPHRIQPLWAIELSIDAKLDQHANYVTQRDLRANAFRTLWSMLWQ